MFMQDYDLLICIAVFFPIAALLEIAHEIPPVGLH